MKVSIGVSNRHIHLTQEHLEYLFGKGYKLKELKKINQPGQFASVETVTIKTEKSSIDNVRILGPIRNYTQIEISKTDAYKLGLNPPVRESGEITDSEKITVVGPKGELNLDEGCIIATRHIHINPKQVEMYGLTGKEYVDVLVGGEKQAILKDVSIKVSDPAYYEMHIDTDDANANLIKNGDVATIIGIDDKNS